MPGHGSLVAIGSMNSHNRFLPGLLTLVRFEAIPGTRQVTMVLTTIGGTEDQLHHDAPDMISIDLDAPAHVMLRSLAESGSGVMRSMFGGFWPLRTR